MSEYISKPIKEEELFKLISNFGLKEEKLEGSKDEVRTSAFQYIDLTYMQSISGGNKAFEQKVTSQFINNTPSHLQELITAYQNQDFKIVKLRSHDLLSTIAIMGLLPILEEKLEILEKTDEKSTLIEDTLNQVNTIITQAISEAEIFSKSL
jgi:HPt (histidine-containing phosphotransfer) domain-containing protein